MAVGKTVSRGTCRTSGCWIGPLTDAAALIRGVRNPPGLSTFSKGPPLSVFVFSELQCVGTITHRQARRFHCGIFYYSRWPSRASILWVFLWRHLNTTISFPSFKAAVLDLLDSPLGPSMPPLHPSVKALSITVSNKNHEDLWNFLNHLCSHPLSLAEIRVNTEADFMESFTWSLLKYDHTNVPPAIVEFLGRLLPFAISLEQRGIRLVDQAGHSLMLAQ
jgi:hypothetical protein